MKHPGEKSTVQSNYRQSTMSSIGNEAHNLKSKGLAAGSQTLMSPLRDSANKATPVVSPELSQKYIHASEYASPASLKKRLKTAVPRHRQPRSKTPLTNKAVAAESEASYGFSKGDCELHNLIEKKKGAMPLPKTLLSLKRPTNVKLERVKKIFG